MSRSKTSPQSVPDCKLSAEIKPKALTMALSDLAYLKPPVEVDDGDYEDADLYSDPPAPEVFPSDPAFVATIFIDASRAWTDDELGRIEAVYTERFPGRRFGFEDLHRESLRYWRPFVFAQGEQLFLRQGYVCNLEARMFRRGRQPHTLFNQQQRHTLHVCGALLWEMLEHAGVELELVEPAQGRRRGVYRAILDEQVGRQLGLLLGLQGEGETPRLLVAHQDLLLACDTPLPEHRIHLSVFATPRTVRDLGRRPDAAHALFEREFSAVRRQVRFELGAAATLFAAEHWPQHRQAQVTPAITVTPGMIATWYSQVLASVRKVVWEAGARAAPRVLRHDLYREAQVHPQIVGVNLPPGDDEDRASYVQLVADEADRIAADFGTPRFPLTSGQVDVHYTDEQWLSAALHGTTFGHDTWFEEPEVLRTAAAWIGDLKRTGKNYLDVFDAERLLQVRDHASGDSEAFFLSQFSEELWAVLLDTAEEVDTRSEGIAVTYAWASDLDRPWSVERTDDTLRLTGPLLSFPACRAAFWREKADLIRELGDFKALV